MAGIILFIAGPVVGLLSGGTILTAGTLGYIGIAVFVGGIASRYAFIEHARPFIQLLLNTGVACLISGLFYLVFLIIMLV